MFVLDAAVADVMIVAATEVGALSLFLVEKGATGMTVETFNANSFATGLSRF